MNQFWLPWPNNIIIFVEILSKKSPYTAYAVEGLVFLQAGFLDDQTIRTADLMPESVVQHFANATASIYRFHVCFKLG